MCLPCAFPASPAPPLPPLRLPVPHLNRFCLPFSEVQASHQRLGALWNPTTTSCGRRVGGERRAGAACEPKQAPDTEGLAGMVFSKRYTVNLTHGPDASAMGIRQGRPTRPTYKLLPPSPRPPSGPHLESGDGAQVKLHDALHGAKQRHDDVVKHLQRFRRGRCQVGNPGWRCWRCGGPGEAHEEPAVGHSPAPQMPFSGLPCRTFIHPHACCHSPLACAPGRRSS